MKKNLIIILISLLFFNINIFAADIEIMQLSPSNEDIINYGDIITFKWESGDFDTYTIQIDYTYQMAKPRKEITISSTEYNFDSAELTIGYHYYWRVIGKKDGKITGYSNIRTYYLE